VTAARLWLGDGVGAAIERVFCVWHSVYDAFYSPDVPKGVMVLLDRAAVWEDKAEAQRVADELNAASNRSTLDRMRDPWVVTEG
jgi:hypothetical protein